MEQLKRIVNARTLLILTSLFFFLQLLQYFFTGAGGPLKLATRLVPVALILYVLKAYKDNELYPRLPRLANQIIATVYVFAALVPLVYLEREYTNLFLFRAGAYNSTDVIIGTILFLLVMEISRKAHTVLFIVNLVLIGYTLWGAYIPIDFFWHPGASLERIITSSTVELTTGVYGKYPQMGLTLIAAFLLLAAVGDGFGTQESLLKVVTGVFGRHKHYIPQTAVVSSLVTGMVSGSGAANSAVTGSVTIPLMKKYGIPAAFAGAVETAASMGGLIMPPLMAAAAFMMADFLGVTYWDVVQRGFSTGFIYYAVVAFSVYLIGLRYIEPGEVKQPPVPFYDKLKTLVFLGCIVLLVVLMGVLDISPMRSAVYAGFTLLVLMIAIDLYYKYVARHPDFAGHRLLAQLAKALETFADLAAYIVILMMVLGIMIGLFTVTGFILRMGQLMLQLGEWHVAAIIVMAWLFGWLAGTGLPPTATYIIVAVIIVPPMSRFGINPWVAHFFAFLISVWGELTPPTSLTAAVASSISGASFMRTAWEALKICSPMFVLSFSIFVRQEILTQTGWPQILTSTYVGVACLGLTFSLFGQFSREKWADLLGRGGLATLGMVAMFYPAAPVAMAASALCLVLLIKGVLNFRIIGTPVAIGPAM
ncbi:MAG: TRAP transporter [Firmicutes bacterium ZCTH02-B6]|nr:MAG: TRAP transporter [Firmicutes bacterium ZCTH02-B6]